MYNDDPHHSLLAEHNATKNYLLMALTGVILAAIGFGALLAWHYAL